MREFYESCMVTLTGAFDRKATPAKHDPLTQVLLEAFECTFLPLPSATFFTMCPLVLRGSLLLQSLITGGVWSRVANFSRP